MRLDRQMRYGQTGPDRQLRGLIFNREGNGTLNEFQAGQ